jgi:hypothetical protein
MNSKNKEQSTPLSAPKTHSDEVTAVQEVRGKFEFGRLLFK